jgi:hypothetical protein
MGWFKSGNCMCKLTYDLKKIEKLISIFCEQIEESKMASFESYLDTVKEIRSKMKELIAVDVSGFLKDQESFNEKINVVMREIMPLSNELVETMRSPMKNYHIEALNKECTMD